jgi:dipeptidyl aminopeptidase/acylaminoacyl peptidase
MNRPRSAANLLAGFLAPVTLCAQLTTSTHWDWRTPSAPSITPGGGSIVYALARQDAKTDANYSNLWIVSIHGENRPLTDGAYRDTSPRVSPDGARVAFLSNRSGSAQIHVRWLDAWRNETQITRADPSPAAGFAWSPDGGSIAYVARVPEEAGFKLPAPIKTPPNAKWAAPPSVVTKLRWRADGTPGQGIVPDGEMHLFVVAADGGAPRQLTRPGISVSGAPSWSPDGKFLAIAAEKMPEADRTLYPADIYIVPAAGGEARRLTSVTGSETSPVYSPDGRSVAFLGFEDKGNAHHTTNLYVVPAAGGAPKQLGAKLDRGVSSPVWRADSRRIWAFVEASGASHLHEFDLDGGVRPLTTGAAIRYGTSYASGDAFTMSRDGRIAVTASTPRDPKDIYTLTAQDPSRVIRLTNVNAALIESNPTGAVEEITYKSFDGRTIQGWIIKPPGFDASRRYPLILDIHGGPHAMYGVEFNWQMQVYAARGFVVLYTNPRGSTGYGEEFGNIIHARYPGDDYKDLMAGVDAVLAKGYVDPAGLFVTGGSGGGILTAWTVTQTNRFAAAVSQYPVINWITQAGASDIPLVMHRWLKAAPWENPEVYLSRSPLFQAAKVATPTMLITGEEDWRTPISQTEEFYVALKTRGVDTVMVRFPNEPHGIRGAHPSHWIAKVEYILAWFERYMKK